MVRNKDFLLKLVVIVIVFLLHLSIFIYRGLIIDFGSYNSLPLNTFLHPKNEYYNKFGNKKFKIILTKTVDLKADFAYQIKDTLKEIYSKNKDISNSKKLLKKSKDLVIKKDNKIFIKGANNKSQADKLGNDLYEELGNGLGGTSKYGHGKGSKFSPASHYGKYLRNPLPPYPRISMQNSEQGAVVLEVIVEPDGNPSKVSIIKSSGYRRLDNSAKTTVEKQYKFIPATRLGIPLRSSYRFAINFKLN